MGQIIIALGFIGIWIAAIVGWILNIVALYHMPFNPITGELAVRVIGVFLGPLGAVMGYI